ncbi:hypothetical protein LTR10_023305 [Elasticomyces elasticus]|uniref:Uncharacterized protein n=1 Tax=Exophiala sideris TaxID=1016849 RepID=A0ABR0JM15_9EURO|nr:hypothetical protein LTR10_023305 [Elasticomyces elasticus]KAK5036544.1 hypothetical protein LTS07_002271 [Exophiala sideris]KAK5041627.1 hypothetical protein LTR13_002294 [Exophiala sideris]KAK5066927.1 hypothetical protein LTR69_002275 [Exophiala sideris]KAK5184986.1 hypothetical protein LTR44_002832 [Eurotiomycetes sp. CCFEE 6388]
MPDLEQLRNLYKSQQWQEFYQNYAIEKQARNFAPLACLSLVYERLGAYEGIEQPYRATIDDWSKWDFYACSINRILGMAWTLPGSPVFGPLENESQLEAYNRAFQLLNHYEYLSITKRSERLLGDNFENNPAVKPRFMIPNYPVFLPTYNRDEFQCIWVNKSQYQEQHPQKAMPKSPFRLLDPRVWNDHQMRDYVRHRLDCRRLGLDIQRFTVKHGENEYDSRSEWPMVQDLLRKAKTKEDLDKFEFYISLEPRIPPDADIFECFYDTTDESPHDADGYVDCTRGGCAHPFSRGRC